MNSLESNLNSPRSRMNDYVVLMPGVYNVVCDAIAALGGVVLDGRYNNLAFLHFACLGGDSAEEQIPGGVWIKCAQYGYENKPNLGAIVKAVFGSKSINYKEFTIDKILGGTVNARIELVKAKSGETFYSGTVRDADNRLPSQDKNFTFDSSRCWIYSSSDPSRENYDKLPDHIKKFVGLRDSQILDGELIDRDNPLELYIDRKYVYTGKYKGEQWQELSIFKLRQITQDETTSPIMKYFAWHQLRRREAYDGSAVEVSFHAINRMSSRMIEVYVDNRFEGEGIVSFLQRLTYDAIMGGELVSVGSSDNKKGKISPHRYKYHGIEFVIAKSKTGGDRLLTIIKVDD